MPKETVNFSLQPKDIKSSMLPVGDKVFGRTSLMYIDGKVEPINPLAILHKAMHLKLEEPIISEIIVFLGQLPSAQTKKETLSRKSVLTAVEYKALVGGTPDEEDLTEGDTSGQMEFRRVKPPPGKTLGDIIKEREELVITGQIPIFDQQTLTKWELNEGVRVVVKPSKVNEDGYADLKCEVTLVNDWGESVKDQKRFLNGLQIVDPNKAVWHHIKDDGGVLALKAA